MTKDPAYPAFLRNITGAVDAGEAPSRTPSSASSVKAVPAPLKDDGPPSPPTPPARSGGGGNGGNSAGRANSKTLSIPLILGVALVAILLNQLFWVYHDRKKEEYNNSPAGLEEIRNERMKLQKKLIEAETERASASGIAVAPVQVQPVSKEGFLATRKQEMIDRCGKRTEAMVYKPDPGCFYFDNSSGTSEKSVGMWSKTRIHVIKPDDDTKQSVVITAADGSTCESGVADSCRSWIQEHQPKDAEGFRKFTVRVPKGQGFIANINTN